MPPGTDTTGAFGDQLRLLNGDVTVCFVPAWHGSGIAPKTKIRRLFTPGTRAD